MANAAIEHKAEAPKGPETQMISVTQPKKLEGLLDTIDLLGNISERLSENAGEDIGSGGGTGQAGDDDDDAATSARARAIAQLPKAQAMQVQLQQHIHKEVSSLRKQVRKLERGVTKPGAAYQLNELYARIRRLNGILHELLHASLDVIKRIYIRVFIDKQSVIG